MKYFSIIQNETFVGVATSADFIYYSPSFRGFLSADETVGQYVELNGKLYRDLWMKPIVQGVDFEQAHITEVSEEDYETYMEAIRNNEEIVVPPYVPPYEEDPHEQVNPDDLVSLEYVRRGKLAALTKACQAAIESGIDVGTHHYSLTQEDQTNLLQAQIDIQNGAENVIYHADGEDYRMFSTEEIELIITKANNWRLENTLYLKGLKKLVNAATTKEEIAAITYER